MNSDDLNSSGMSTENRKFIRIKNEYLDSKNYFIKKYKTSGLYLLANMMTMNLLWGGIFVCKQNIIDWYRIDEQKYYKKLKSIYELIKTLNEDDIIIITKPCNLQNKNLYFFAELGDAKVDEDGYFMVYDFEIETFRNYNGELSIEKMFAVFCSLKRHYNSVTKICYPTYELIREETGIADSSIAKYINELRDIGLILYDNIGIRYLAKTDVIQECGNTYTMNYIGNQKYLDDGLERYRKQTEEKERTYKKHTLSNSKRSIKQKLNILEKKFKNNIVDEEEYIKTKEVLEIGYKSIEDSYRENN